jgi:nucleoid-associated protein YgaU
MPKLTNKRNQDKGSAAAEPDHSTPGTGEVEEDQQHPIPFGASIYWEIPGDVPGASRRRVPLPAEPDLPEIPGAVATQATPDKTGNVETPDYSPDVSAHRKISTDESDDTRASANSSATLPDSPSDALPSQVDTNNLKTSDDADESSVAPDVSDNSGLAISDQAVETNSSATESHAPASPTETPELNAQTKSVVKPADGIAESITTEPSFTNESESDKSDLPAEQDNQGNQSELIQPLDTMPTAAVADSKNMEEVNGEKMVPNPHTEYLSGANHQDTQSNEKARKNYAIPALLALLLFLLLGGVGYDYLNDSKEQQVVAIRQTESQAPLNETPEPVAVSANSAANTQVKVIEISVGKLDPYAISGIRMITHRVVRGDTLWDIAESYHNNPWRYPELAERSRIKNPDLIYPGDLVHIHIKVT